MSDQTELFFYDLETTGIDVVYDRILQFAGIRTDLDLNQIGEPVNFYVKLNPEVLPGPTATTITHILPAAVASDPNAKTEYEAAVFIRDHIFTKNTVVVGYNNIGFDDRAIQHLFYRNFIDAYSWQWQDGRGKWDLLGVTQMVRALRPEGINWPFNEKTTEVNDPETGEVHTKTESRPNNKLENLATFNNIEQTNAHDALSDVEALIGLARLIKTSQPKMYKYLFDTRTKGAVANVVNKLTDFGGNSPFLYTCGRFKMGDSQTSAVVKVQKNSSRSGSAGQNRGNSNEVFVYDLRRNPADFQEMLDDDLAQMFAWNLKDEDGHIVRPPLLSLKLNGCPAVAPVDCLDEPSEERINLTKDEVFANLKTLSSPEFIGLIDRLFVAQDAARKIPRTTGAFGANPPSKVSNPKPAFHQIRPADDPEGKLYSGAFISSNDKTTSERLHRALATAIPETPSTLPSHTPAAMGSDDDSSLKQKAEEHIAQTVFDDDRLNQMLLRFKGHYLPHLLTPQELDEYQNWIDSTLQANQGLWQAELDWLLNDEDTSDEAKELLRKL
jgi:exodeoxyribonuclease-1